MAKTRARRAKLHAIDSARVHNIFDHTRPTTETRATSEKYDPAATTSAS